MKKIILALASLTVLVGQAFAAGVLINGNQINPQTAISISTLTVTGAGGMAVTNSITASSITVNGNSFSVGGSTLVVSGGNVGIGTTASAEPLRISGKSYFDTNGIGGSLKIISTETASSQWGGSIIMEGNTGNAAPVVFFGAIEAGKQTTSGDGDYKGLMKFYTDASNGVANNVRMVIDGSGNVGIGTTSPGAILDVESSGNTSSQIGGSSSRLILNSGSYPYELSDNYRAAGAFDIYNTATSDSNLVILDNGNVGIGTTSPATTLDVNGSATLELGTTGAVLCLTSSHVIGHCTSGASCLTTCTCTCTAN